MKITNLENFLNNYSTLNHYPILKALIIVFIYLIIAKIADLILDRVLRRLASVTKTTLDDKIIKLLHAPLFGTIILFGILNAILIWKIPSPWDYVIPDTIKSFILLLWVIAALRIVGVISDISLSSLIHQGSTGKDIFLLLKNVIRVVILVCGILWILSIWKVNLTPLFASAGIAGIAVALAAKDSLANFFGGISIFFDKAYQVGDYIILDSGERGEVVDIGIRSTRIKTRDDVLITIPNSIMANSKIINESAPIPRFRIRVPVGVAYGSNLKKVEQLMLKVAQDNPRVVKEPPARVRLREFADSSINFELLCWVSDPSLKGLTIHELLYAIYDTFEQNQIVIPFPQRDIHLYSEKI